MEAMVVSADMVVDTAAMVVATVVVMAATTGDTVLAVVATVEDADEHLLNC